MIAIVMLSILLIQYIFISKNISKIFSDDLEYMIFLVAALVFNLLIFLVLTLTL